MLTADANERTKCVLFHLLLLSSNSASRGPCICKKRSQSHIGNMIEKQAFCQVALRRRHLMFMGYAPQTSRGRSMSLTSAILTFRVETYSVHARRCCPRLPVSLHPFAKVFEQLLPLHAGIGANYYESVERRID